MKTTCSQTLPNMNIDRALLYFLNLIAGAILMSCTNSPPVDQTNPISVVKAFETKKATNDADGAVQLLSPSMRELAAKVGGPRHAQELMHYEYDTVRKHGGLKTIEIIKDTKVTETKHAIRYKMTANDGTSVDGTQTLSLIDGKWYIGQAESML